MQHINTSPAVDLTKENAVEVLSSFGLSEHKGSLFMSSSNNYQSNYEVRDNEFYICIRYVMSTTGGQLSGTTVSSMSGYYDCCGGYISGEEWNGKYYIHLSYRYYKSGELSNILGLHKMNGRKNLVSRRDSEDIAAWSNSLEEWW